MSPIGPTIAAARRPLRPDQLAAKRAYDRAYQRRRYVPHPRTRKATSTRIWPKVCTVAGCVRRVHARALCGSHYHKWRAVQRRRGWERV